MNTKRRRMFGSILMLASVLAAILIQALTGRVLMFQSGPIEFSGKPELTISTSEAIGFHWGFVIPLASVFVIGLICCAWPTRKPPRITES